MSPSQTVKARVRWGTLLTQLDRFYSNGKWKVPVLRERGADPFRVLVSTVISHRTRDQVTMRAALRLLRAYPTPVALAEATPREISRLIQDAGLGESKARGLHRAAVALVSQHNGRVPDTEKELVSLPLVGRKTASAIIVFGFGQAAIPADTHIHRVVNRLGVIRTKTPDATSIALRYVVPRRYWARLNPTLVQHGQNICRFSRPLCHACPIRADCMQVGVPTVPNSK